MTPADIERAVEALRRAFPHVADEGVERFRRQLTPLPVWRPASYHWSLWGGGPYAIAEAYENGGVWRWHADSLAGPENDYASTRSEAMRAAERALGLPECEVVR